MGLRNKLKALINHDRKVIVQLKPWDTYNFQGFPGHRGRHIQVSIKDPFEFRNTMNNTNSFDLKNPWTSNHFDYTVQKHVVEEIIKHCPYFDVEPTTQWLSEHTLEELYYLTSFSPADNRPIKTSLLGLLGWLLDTDVHNKITLKRPEIFRIHPVLKKLQKDDPKTAFIYTKALRNIYRAYPRLAQSDYILQRVNSEASDVARVYFLKALMKQRQSPTEFDGKRHGDFSIISAYLGMRPRVRYKQHLPFFAHFESSFKPKEFVFDNYQLRDLEEKYGI